MQRFSVIGTAHIDDPELLRALVEALDEAAPDQLILEMPDDAVAAGNVALQKPEMLVAYRWAEKRGIPVRGHEPPGLSVLRDGLAPERRLDLVKEMDGLVSSLTARRTFDIFCKLGPPETLAERRLSAVLDELIDPQKASARTQAIVAAVQQLAAPEGVVLIICGGNHVAQIAEALPGCRIIRGDHFF